MSFLTDRFVKIHLEDVALAEVKARVENWARCLKDSPRVGLSITGAAMQRLKEMYFDALNNPDYYKFKSSGSAYGLILDYQDAIFLEMVWRKMGDPSEENIWVPNTSFRMRTAQQIIRLYAFGEKPKEMKNLLRFTSTRGNRFQVEKQCLLFFHRRIKEAEKEQANMVACPK